MSSLGRVPERECCAEQEGGGEEKQREHTYGRFFSSPKLSADQHTHVRKAFGAGERTTRKEQNNPWSSHRARSSLCFHQLE